MNVICPHCQRPIGPPIEPSHEPLRCPSCGGLAAATQARVRRESPQFDDLLSTPALPQNSGVTLPRRPRRKRTVGLRTILAGAAVCFLILAAVWTVQEVRRWWNRFQGAQQEAVANDDLEPPLDPSRPTWPPDPALVAELSGEAGIQRYVLRIPGDFAEFPVRQPRWLPPRASFYANSWLQVPERQALIVASMTKYPNAEMAGSDLEAALERFYERMQSNVQATAFEKGSTAYGYLGGEKFIKGAFSGRIRFDRDLPRAKRSGQVLIHLEGNEEIVVYFLCDSGVEHDLFRRLETSLRTLRPSTQF